MFMLRYIICVDLAASNVNWRNHFFFVFACFELSFDAFGVVLCEMKPVRCGAALTSRIGTHRRNNYKAGY